MNGHAAWIPLILLGMTPGPLPAGGPTGPIAWAEWTDAAFERARHEDRFVLLDLEAVWCHWCHVMDATTYRDPEVVALVAARFVPVRVDQDARPDLSNRYEDFGWPATVVFDGAGREIVKFQGYIPPERMRALLRGIVADPTPGPSVTLRPTPALPPDAAMSCAVTWRTCSRSATTSSAEAGASRTSSWTRRASNTRSSAPGPETRTPRGWRARRWTLSGRT